MAQALFQNPSALFRLTENRRRILVLTLLTFAVMC